MTQSLWLDSESFPTALRLSAEINPESCNETANCSDRAYRPPNSIGSNVSRFNKAPWHSP